MEPKKLQRTSIQQNTTQFRAKAMESAAIIKQRQE